MDLASFIDAEREHLLRRYEGVMLAMRGIESLGAKDIDDNDIAALFELVERLGTDIHTSLAAFIEVVDAFPKQPKKEEEKAK